MRDWTAPLPALRALEGVLESQVGALDEAGARVEVRAETAAARLSQERETYRCDRQRARRHRVACERDPSPVAPRSSNPCSNSAEGTLKTAGQSLETQAASFRTAADIAAEAPRSVAVELDKQARAHRVGCRCGDGRAPSSCSAVTSAIARRWETVAAPERGRFEFRDIVRGPARVTRGGSRVVEFARRQQFGILAENADRRLELITTNAAARNTQLTAGFALELERLRELSEGAQSSLAKLVESLHDAGIGAQNADFRDCHRRPKNSAKGAGRRGDGGRRTAPASGRREWAARRRK